MAEDKKEPWLNYLAFTTIIFAVAATLSTSKGGSYSTRSLLQQEQASNKWSYFQSKSIKQYLYETQKGLIELEIIKIPNSDRVTRTEYQKRIEDFGKSIERYEKEKNEIKVKAEKLEKDRDESQLHAKAFGMAVIFLQIAILLSSIGALMKRKYLWYLALATGVIGLFYFINGFLLFM